MTSELRVGGFTPEHDALLRRGWPEIRILTDERVTAKKALVEVNKAVRAIDPYFGVEIPRDVARLYVRRYTSGTLGNTHGDVSKDDGPIDRTWLDVLLTHRIAPNPTLPYGGETYNFRLAEMIYLFEAFLGTETVVEAFARHLDAARRHPAWWGDFVDHEHTESARVARVLGWLRLRMNPARFDALVAPLAEPNPKLPRYSEALRLLADPKSPLPDVNDWLGESFAAQRRDAAWIEASVRKKGRFSPSQALQTLAVAGGDLLFLADPSRVARLPKWEQLRFVVEVGSLRHPGTARAIAGLLTSRSVGASARAWVWEHKEWLEREALPVLDGRDPAAAAAIRATLKGEEPPPPKPVKELKRDLKVLIDGIEARLAATKGNEAAERRVLADAFHAYCAIRSALGEVIPDAYFTHTLGDCRWKGDKPTIERWMDLAVNVANNG